MKSVTRGGIPSHLNYTAPHEIIIFGYTLEGYVLEG